jgi:excisionase family DNA binding protein
VPPILLTAREMAQRLGSSYETVLTWARREEIPCIRDSRNRVLFNLDAVLLALRSRGDRPASREQPAVQDQAVTP